MTGVRQLATFDWSLLGAPLVAGLLVVSTHVALGREVLRRGIIFIDLTIAQIAALGAVIAEAAGAGESGWQVRVAGGVAALLAAMILARTERHWPALQEAIIGCLYVVAASLAIIVLANNPHGAEHFTHLVAGQILWVSFPQLMPVAVLYTAILAIWMTQHARNRGWFYPLFALTITASVQLVGVYLVFATLILPALAAHGQRSTAGFVLAYAIGVLGYITGLWLSVPWDLPSGPLIVCALAVIALVAGLARRWFLKIANSV
jgi:zinc/manganese transport system permease protein